jgi:hypothetical protein
MCYHLNAKKVGRARRVKNSSFIGKDDPFEEPQRDMLTNKNHFAAEMWEYASRRGFFTML